MSKNNISELVLKDLKESANIKPSKKLKLKESENPFGFVSNIAGDCPVCGGRDMDYRALELEGEMSYYPWTCNLCGATGEEWYSMEFAGHNVDMETEGLVEVEPYIGVGGKINESANVLKENTNDFKDLPDNIKDIILHGNDNNVENATINVACFDSYTSYNEVYDSYEDGEVKDFIREQEANGVDWLTLRDKLYECAKEGLVNACFNKYL